MLELVNCKMTNIWFIFIPVVRHVKRFLFVLAEDDVDQIVEDFNDLQFMPVHLLPTYSRQKASEGILGEYHRLDEFWAAVLKMCNKVTSKPRFPFLTKLILCLMAIPNSNADCERTFSMVRKIYTETRPDLDSDTITALFSCKLNMDTKSYDFKPSANLLQKAKQATRLYNNSLKIMKEKHIS